MAAKSLTLEEYIERQEQAGRGAAATEQAGIGQARAAEADLLTRTLTT